MKVTKHPDKWTINAMNTKIVAVRHFNAINYISSVIQIDDDDFGYGKVLVEEDWGKYFQLAMKALNDLVEEVIHQNGKE